MTTASFTKENVSARKNLPFLLMDSAKIVVM